MSLSVDETFGMLFLRIRYIARNAVKEDRTQQNRDEKPEQLSKTFITVNHMRESRARRETKAPHGKTFRWMKNGHTQNGEKFPIRKDTLQAHVAAKIPRTTSF